jgi:hypothetical protein
MGRLYVRTLILGQISIYEKCCMVRRSAIMQKILSQQSILSPFDECIAEYRMLGCFREKDRDGYFLRYKK